MHELQRTYEKEIEQLAAACRRTAELGYATSQGGNLSYRVAPDVILITPTKVAKREIAFEDIVIIDAKGQTLHATPGRKPTGEAPFHLRIFSRRPDLNGLVHAHPPLMTGFSLADTDLLERPFLPEPIVEVGPVATVAYAEPLSEALAQAFDAKLDCHNAFLMKNHGVMFTSVEGVGRALELLEMCEAAAKSLLVAEVLGGANSLGRQDVADLERVMQTRSLPQAGKPGAVKGLIAQFFS